MRERKITNELLEKYKVYLYEQEKVLGGYSYVRIIFIVKWLVLKKEVDMLLCKGKNVELNSIIIIMWTGRGDVKASNNDRQPNLSYIT